MAKGIIIGFIVGLIVGANVVTAQYGIQTAPLGDPYLDQMRIMQNQQEIMREMRRTNPCP